MKKFLLPLSYVLVIIATVLGTLVFTQTPTGLPKGTYKLQELESLLTQRFVDGADAQVLQDAAADAMVEALGDRWSYYIPAAEYEAYEANKKNAYVGVGITVDNQTGHRVTKVTAGGPAAEAGVQPGDEIIAVDGTDVRELSGNEMAGLVRGPEGTQVSLTVLREGQELTLTMERRTIYTTVASGKLLEDGVGLVTIENFNTNCYKETMAAVQQLLEQGATALIFDVRNNGGGYKRELVKVLDDLLPEGDLFRSEYYTGATSVDKSDPECLEIPMAVLVNSESYSAAEFFAAALQEYDWAVVVGRYCTPNGVNLEGVGITPDIIVEVDDETAAKIYAGTLNPVEDPQIIAAIHALKSAK